MNTNEQVAEKMIEQLVKEVGFLQTVRMLGEYAEKQADTCENKALTAPEIDTAGQLSKYEYLYGAARWDRRAKAIDDMLKELAKEAN